MVPLEKLILAEKKRKINLTRAEHGHDDKKRGTAKLMMVKLEDDKQPDTIKSENIDVTVENVNAINHDVKDADANFGADVGANAETNNLDIGNDESGNNDTNNDHCLEADPEANGGKEEVEQSEPARIRSSTHMSSFNPGIKRRREIPTARIENSKESSSPRFKRRKNDQLITACQPHISPPTAHKQMIQGNFNNCLQELKVLVTACQPQPHIGSSTSHKQMNQVQFSNRLQELKTYKTQHGHCNVSGKKYKSLRIWCDKVRSSMKKKERNEIPEINLSDNQIKVLTDMEFVWDQHNFRFFEALKTYKAQHGHCNVSCCDEEKYMSLRIWCDKVRSSMKTRARNETPEINLSDNQIKVLTDMEIVWEKTFCHYLEDLRAFKARHGHCNVSLKEWNKYSDLKTWCDKVRSPMKKKGRNETPEINLSDNQIKVLTDMEFVWDQHNFHLEALKTYKAQHGHCNVSCRDEDRYTALNIWCDKVRSSMKKKERNETPEIDLSGNQIKVLTDMEIVWEKTFCHYLEDLRAFKAQHGHCNVLKSDGKKYMALRIWCSKVRSSMINLSDNQIKVLTDIEFVWNQHNFRYLEALKAYKAQHGHCNVSFRDEDKHKHLLHWCGLVRMSMKKRARNETPEINLSDNQIKDLTEIEFDWNFDPRTENPVCVHLESAEMTQHLEWTLEC